MPLPIWLAHRLAERLAEVRKAGAVPYLRPDGKTQVTFEYVDGKPVTLQDRADLAPSTQDGIDRDTVIRPDLIEQVIRPIDPRAVRRRRLRGLRQPDRQVRHRRPARRHRPHRPQDHRRHLRRHGPSRWRRVLAARTRARSTVRPPTPPAGSPSTSSPPAPPSAARSRSPTPSAWPTRCASSSRPSAPTKVDPAEHRAGRPRGVRPAPGRDRPRPRPQRPIYSRRRRTATSAAPGSPGSTPRASTRSRPRRSLTGSRP